MLQLSLPGWPETSNFRDSEGRLVIKEGLESLFRVSNIHRDYLQQVHIDLLRENSGLKTVYCLDFDIIYAYMNPYGLDTDSAGIIDFFLNNANFKFSIPIGTSLEILRYLDRVSEYITQTARLEISDSLRIVDTVNPEDLFRSKKPVATVKNLGRGMRYEQSLDRLVELLTKENVQFVQDILVDPDKISFDLSTYDKALSKLKAERPSARYKMNNVADAMNIASIRSYNDYYLDQACRDMESVEYYYFCLITHTKAIVNTIKDLGWQSDPVYTSRAMSSDLNRTPHYIIYNHFIEQRNKDAPTAVKLATAIDMQNKCSRVMRRLNEIPGMDRIGTIPIRPRETDFSFRQALVDMDGKYRIPRWIKDFTKNIHEPFISLIEEVLSYDAALTDGKRALIEEQSAAEEQTLSLKSISLNERLRSYLLLIREECVSNINIPVIDRYKKLTDDSFDIPKIEEKLFGLGYRTCRNEIVNSEHFRILKTTGRQKVVVFVLDAYPEYYSAFWPTHIALSQFCTLANSVFGGFAHNDIDKNRTYDPMIGGIMLFGRKKRYFDRLILPLTTHWIKSKIGNDLIFIRINAPRGSLCYDVLPELQRPKNLGIISHLRESDWITLQFKETGRYFVPSNILKEKLDKYLASYPRNGHFISKESTDDVI